MFAKSHHLNQEEIALYVDALKLSKIDQLPEELLIHVADCEECKTEITEVFSLLEEQEYSREAPHPYFDRANQGKMKRPWQAYRIAAILALGIGIGAIVYYLSVTTAEQEMLIPAQSSRPAEVGNESTGVAGKTRRNADQPGKELFAGNFIESPNLEDLVNNELRSAEIQVLSPANGAVVSERLLFEWRGSSEGPFVFHLLTNTESVLVSRTVTESRIVPEVQLAPGLYYWKLESAGELLHVGKFFVK
jgi:hypothetical protein